MRTYYLISSENPAAKGHYHVFVSDNKNAGTVLMEIPAKSYTDANKAFTFSLSTGAEYADMRVSPRPLAGIVGEKRSASDYRLLSAFIASDELRKNEWRKEENE